MKRRVYLAMKGLEEARELFFSALGDRRSGAEEVPVADCLGRITSEPVFAMRSAPSYHSAAMDGIAVVAETTFGTTERRPRILEIGKEAVWINTGMPLPRPFDAVIMVEKLHQTDEQHVEIRSPAHPWQNVRKVGEDMVATQLLFPQNHRIRPYDIGALVSGGITIVKVWRSPLVRIIPTGSELVSHETLQEGEALEAGRIIEYNSLILGALVREAGGVPDIRSIVEDEPAAILETLREAVASDAHIVIINAGSSAGSKDYTVHAIAELGEVLVHGVAMMPGKPTILGIVEGKPVIGNPGYAVSSALSFEQFVKPLIYRLQGCREPRPRQVRVVPSRNVTSRLGLEEFLRVNIGKVGDKLVATPLARAAGSITTLTRAEGIIRIDALSEGVTPRESVPAELLVDEEELDRTVVVIGSHDLTIDILGDEIRRKGTDIRISSANVGSMGGLMALRKGTCHMAGSHLLDTATGRYNISYIEKYLPGIPVHVYHLVLREQGLMVAPGNPKKIRGLEDLAGGKVSFVNRQAGSGTRILLDYKLEQSGIASDSIRGYDHEEFTHMAVAVDILSGAADAGMGIYAAAKALGLDFIPIEREQYDLIIPERMVEHPNIRAVLETIRTDTFRERVAALGGYDPSRSGRLWMRVG
ncbi:MAG: molybdopterin biosynthesis protein [Deltaproteobacteria bacterium]|nr:molybdopterin biosynthesis protein [Deltaproteobacteria bacterium]MBW1923604.1 molybdopterin biosynthesis protein [Deltaproteobacteria bacterium]MBW1948695.1 molybdopterin biosynthesis protein [Deltaproteobacteria bacterium]MBW2006864.1 molybdopterin biosynthesis protein [Deltaproteobacteria bacterium]MBW2101119.1 molybdopterin biosynthesis protein [Deltaproteobacteria bacterium]